MAEINGYIIVTISLMIRPMLHMHFHVYHFISNYVFNANIRVARAYLFFYKNRYLSLMFPLIYFRLTRQFLTSLK